MPGWVASVAWTALLSVVSSWAFLVVRCRGLGRPFGPTSKWWAFAVVIITSAVATGLGVAVAAAGHHLRAAYIGLIVPSGLWLGRLAEQQQSRRRGRWRPEVLAGRLTFFVRRMDDRIGDDLEAWCDARLRAACGSPEVLGEATTYYHGRIVARWAKGDRRRQALDRARDSILHKAGVVQLINFDTEEWRLEKALRAHPSTSPLLGKYTRKELGGRLLDSAENELRVMLADEYRRGRGKLLIYGLLAPGTIRSRPDSAPG
jgi:hypothetical protein